jgi:hypothetical protein
MKKSPLLDRVTRTSASSSLYALFGRPFFGAAALADFIRRRGREKEKTGI